MNDSESLIQVEEQVSPVDHLDPAGDDEPTEGLSLKVTRFLRLCWQRRRMFIWIIAAGISISTVLAVLEPNSYTSTTTFMPPDSTSSYSNFMNMMTSNSSAASLGSQLLGLDTPGELFVSIMKSRNVQDSLIQRLNLANYYHARRMVDARQSLAGATQVSEDRKSGLITVSVTAGSPEVAADIARGYVAELNRVLNVDSTSAARRERIFLEGRVKEVKQELDESSRALSQFSTKSGTIDISAQAKSMVDAGERLQADLIAARSELAGLRQTYSEDNPRVRAVEARIAELQRQMDAMGGMGRQPASNSDAKKRGYPSASELPTLGLTYYDLERKVRVQEAVWEALTKQYEMAKVEEAAQTPAARVLDVADVPERKSGPVRRFIVMVGALLSLLLACILVVVLTIWEGMDPQEEPKKLILEIADTVLDRQRWYWSLPGMGRLHHRFIE